MFNYIFNESISFFWMYYFIYQLQLGESIDEMMMYKCKLHTKKRKQKGSYVHLANKLSN